MTNCQLNNFLQSFAGGQSSRAGEYLGSHLTDNGAFFRVWAPNAVQISVAGDFNNWKNGSNTMKYVSGGIWETFIKGAAAGQSYKYVIASRDGQTLWKADPYAVYSELRPGGASKLYELSGFNWSDSAWLSARRQNKVYNSPVNIYELHSGSWKRHEDGSFLSYGELSDELVPYVKKMGFTHIELMPLTEYPYDASWGYQCTGYFSATSRYGTPHELMKLINACHRAGIGVIMDWVPAHFPKDPHGLVEFDGSRLYEDSDPQMAEHPSWGTRIFDYSKGEVRSFLTSSALFWLEHFHIDGLRVDAVASMLYLDYDRKDGAWRRNKHGGNENLCAVDFLRSLNECCFTFDDSIMMIAEESTAWPLVTAPVYAGGLGFNLKWNMGWMNDSLRYLKTDPLYRSGSHSDLTFSLMYAFSENFVLPLSHDEVVHMKGSLMGKAPGNREQKLSGVRSFWAYMLAHPGKKLLFMGAELGQESEWNFEAALPWELLDNEDNSALHLFFEEANRFYRRTAPLWEIDFDSQGFSWICPDERDKNIISFLRRDKNGDELIFLCSFSGAETRDFRLGVPNGKTCSVVFSTDEIDFGGSGSLKKGKRFSIGHVPHHGFNSSITLNVPPLAAVFLKVSGVSVPPSRLTKPSSETANK